MRVEMLAVGRELLIGRTLNTNATWVGRRLGRLGALLNEVTTVDDDLGEIAGGLRGCLDRRSDYIVVVGGLGPTPDDMTLKGISGALGVGLRLNEKALTLVRENYAKRNLGNMQMTPARRKMATLPMGSAPVRNGVGTAPGVKIQHGGATIYCLPGVPSEMKSIFAESVEPEIAKSIGPLHREYISMKVEGIYESTLAPLIGAELRRTPEAYIKSHPRGIREGRSKIELDVAVVSRDRADAKQTARKVAESLRRSIAAQGGTVVSEKTGVPRTR